MAAGKPELPAAVFAVLIIEQTPAVVSAFLLTARVCERSWLVACREEGSMASS
ncbi:hypothetical protein NLX62_02160 [Mycobacteriaceae bacterium Msp059]|nr:hypothetical protein [Mycobacteriaceae bacterium Msp059]